MSPTLSLRGPRTSPATGRTRVLPYILYTQSVHNLYAVRTHSVRSPYAVRMYKLCHLVCLLSCMTDKSHAGWHNLSFFLTFFFVSSNQRFSLFPHFLSSDVWFQSCVSFWTGRSSQELSSTSPEIRRQMSAPRWWRQIKVPSTSIASSFFSTFFSTSISGTRPTFRFQISFFRARLHTHTHTGVDFVNHLSLSRQPTTGSAFLSP